MQNLECEECGCGIGYREKEGGQLVIDDLEGQIYFTEKKLICGECFKKNLNTYHGNSKLILPQNRGWLMLF